jgi:hypothetical protein
MRRFAKILVGLGLLSFAVSGVAWGEQKKTKKQQERDCDTEFESCAKSADDWFNSVDPTADNIDTYGVMLGGCRARQHFCKKDIKRTTRVGTQDATVPPQGGVAEPAPPKKKEPVGRPATGGVSPN